MRDLHRELARRLAAGESAVVATIVRKSGSAPRSGGSKMLVREGGSLAGSVGGGRLEAETLALAAEVFRARVPRLQAFDLSGADAEGTDMLCGGRGEILVDFIGAGDPAEVALFARAAELLERGRAGWLLTWLDGAARRHGLVPADGAALGRVEGAAERVRALALEPGARTIRVETLGGARVVVEPLVPQGRLLVFGAGHCAQQLVPIAAAVGFAAEVVDDRAEFASRERFPEPTRLAVVASFEQLPSLAIDADTYVVIMTRGHAHDLAVLEQCLRAPAGYVGMIGSVRKRDKVFEALRRRGFGDTDFARVHSPIGIEIAAETPEEIAISIVAELIRVRAARSGRGADAEPT